MNVESKSMPIDFSRELNPFKGKSGRLTELFFHVIKVIQNDYEKTGLTFSCGIINYFSFLYEALPKARTLKPDECIPTDLYPEERIYMIKTALMVFHCFLSIPVYLAHKSFVSCTERSSSSFLKFNKTLRDAGTLLPTAALVLYNQVDESPIMRSYNPVLLGMTSMTIGTFSQILYAVLKGNDSQKKISYLFWGGAALWYLLITYLVVSIHFNYLERGNIGVFNI